MTNSTMKLSISDDKYTVDIYESEPGTLVIELSSTDPDDQNIWGQVTTDSEAFLKSLQKLLK